MKSGFSDSCGCALSAKVMAVALVASGAYYGWRFGMGELSLTRMALRVFLVTFIAAGVGKAIGILRYRWRGKTRLRMAC